jgi:hypothetical protein
MVGRCAVKCDGGSFGKVINFPASGAFRSFHAFLFKIKIQWLLRGQWVRNKQEQQSAADFEKKTHEQFLFERSKN